jgi:hypothetical protein
MCAGAGNLKWKVCVGVCQPMNWARCRHGRCGTGAALLDIDRLHDLQQDERRLAALCYKNNSLLRPLHKRCRPFLLKFFGARQEAVAAA